MESDVIRRLIIIVCKEMIAKKKRLKKRIADEKRLIAPAGDREKPHETASPWKYLARVRKPLISFSCGYMLEVEMT